MSIDTLRTSKMRSALTVLGVVIGITSIVGMTSLIRGFDQSLRDSIGQLGPNTIFVQKMGALSFGAGKTFLELIKRPEPDPEDAAAIARESPSIALIDVWLGAPAALAARVYYGSYADHATGDSRCHRKLRRRQLRQARARPLLHPGRSRAPASGGRARPDAVTCRSFPTSIRSARRCASARTSSP